MIHFYRAGKNVTNRQVYPGRKERWVAFWKFPPENGRMSPEKGPFLKKTSSSNFQPPIFNGYVSPDHPCMVYLPTFTIKINQM